MGTIFVDTLEPQSGTSLTLGASGDTVGLASGASQTLAVNTPAFFVSKSSNQSVSATTSTLITFDTEKFDSDNTFDTSTGKFTPATSGKYFLFAQMNIQDMHDQATTEFDIKKNGSVVSSRFKHVALNSSSDRDPSLFTACIVDSDADDYFQVIAYTDFGSGLTVTGSSTGFTFFSGYKLIGA
jgi:hypothetical protein